MFFIAFLLLESKKVLKPFVFIASLQKKKKTQVFLAFLILEGKKVETSIVFIVFLQKKLKTIGFLLRFCF